MKNLENIIICAIIVIGVVIMAFLILMFREKNTPYDGERAMVRYGFGYHAATIHDDNDGVIFQLDNGIMGDLSQKEWYPLTPCETKTE